MAAFLLLACGGSGNSDSAVTTSGGNTVNSTIDSSGFAASVSSSSTSATKYDSSDIVVNSTFSNTVTIDFTASTVKLDSGTVQAITSTGVTVLTNVSVAATTYGITITSTTGSMIKYELTGTLAGTLTVNSSSNYQLYLNGLMVSATAGPAFDLESSAKAFIVLAAGTANTLTDSSTRSMTMKAALYGKGIMVFSGSGTLSATGSYKHGIFSNDYIRFCGGTYTVNVSAKDAVRSVNGFIFDDGTLTVNATGTTTDDESKGITASWDIDEDTTTYTTGNPDPFVIINNGVIKVTTTGTSYEYTTDGTTYSCSPEGIEGKSTLTINSGYIIINTNDDALNAGDALTINDGYIYCKSTGNDAIDSNGTMTINGGVIVAIGYTAPEGAFDCDANNFTVTGGTFVGIGGTTSSPTASLCTQNTIILGSLTSGSKMAIAASNGTVVFSFTIPQSYTTMLLSSPDIVTGTKYTVYTGGAASGDDTFYGMYLDSLAYSGGTAGSRFTVSSRVTQLGGSVAHN